MELRYVPGTHYQATAVWLVLNIVDEFGQLVNPFVCVIGVHTAIGSAPVSPLKAVYRTEITLFAVCQADRMEVLLCTIAIPYIDLFIFEQLVVCCTFDKPK
jgi:hypothetical protein